MDLCDDHDTKSRQEEGGRKLPPKEDEHDGQNGGEGAMRVTPPILDMAIGGTKGSTPADVGEFWEADPRTQVVPASSIQHPGKDIPYNLPLRLHARTGAEGESWAGGGGRNDMAAVRVGRCLLRIDGRDGDDSEERPCEGNHNDDHAGK
jgi:hypothetical protein